MVELTRVITIEITTIQKYNDEIQEPIPHDKTKGMLVKKLKEAIVCDDVLVTNVQDFIREVKGNGN